MNKPSPGETRASLEAILIQSVDCALALKKALGDERDALERRDTATLEQAIGRKATQVRELAGLEQNRSRVCAEAGFGASPEDMQKITDWCGGTLALRNSWQRLRDVTQDCDSLNQGNGAIIHLRQRQISDGLALLRGSEHETNTYGPTGAARGNNAGSRALTEA